MEEETVGLYDPDEGRTYRVPSWVYDTGDDLFIEDAADVLILKWLDERAPMTNLAAITPDDADLGDLLAEWLAPCYMWLSDKHMWRRYDHATGAWTASKADIEVAKECKEFCKCLRLHCDVECAKVRLCHEDALPKSAVKLWDQRTAAYKGSIAKQKALLESARTGVSHESAELDPDPTVLNCKGWLVSLTDHSSRRTRPDDMCGRSCSVEWHDGMAGRLEGSRFARFLDEITRNNKEKKDFLQRALGYSATGSAQEECMFVAYGKTARNGKGALFNTVERALGTYARVATTGLIVHADGRRRDTGESASPMLASLSGSRYVPMSEPPRGSVLDDAAVKSMTGNDPIYARELYQPMGDTPLRPSWHMWLSCNTLPRVTDLSVFDGNRLRVVTFDRHFTEEEQDRTLKTTLATRREQEAVIEWLVTGARSYAAMGLSEPECVKASTEAWCGSSDLIATFLKERCDTDPINTAYVASRTSVYTAYREWCDEYGIKPWGKRSFYDAMREHSIAETKRNGIQCFRVLVK